MANFSQQEALAEAKQRGLVPRDFEIEAQRVGGQAKQNLISTVAPLGISADPMDILTSPAKLQATVGAVAPRIAKFAGDATDVAKSAAERVSEAMRGKRDVFPRVTKEDISRTAGAAEALPSAIASGANQLVSHAKAMAASPEGRHAMVSALEELTGVPSFIRGHDEKSRADAALAHDPAAAGSGYAASLGDEAQGAATFAGEGIGGRIAARVLRQLPAEKAAASAIMRKTAIPLAAGTALAGDAAAEPKGAQATAAASAKVADLENNAKRFDMDHADRASVRKAQEFLQGQGLYLKDDNGRPVIADGVWGRGMTKAVGDYLTHNKTELETARKAMTEAQREDASAETQSSPATEALREWGPLAAMVGGIAGGHVSRLGAVGKAAEKLAERNSAADKLLRGLPSKAIVRGKTKAAMAAAQADVAKRVKSVNAFYRLGLPEKANERVPYAPAKAGPGFKPRPKAAEASELFPPKGTTLRIADLGVVGGAGGEAAFSFAQSQLAQKEVDSARADVAKDPTSKDARVRLEQALDTKARWDALWRAGAGVAAGRAEGAFTHRYSHEKPNIGAAENQQMLINQHLKWLADEAKNATARKKKKKT